MVSVSVLVVGGSLVGLSASVFLAARGVDVLCVEKHPGSSPHPRAIGFTPRTLELYRAVGLGDRIPQAPANHRLIRRRVESLAGPWFEDSPWTPKAPATSQVEYSPCRGAAIAQDRLEGILRDRAVELGADVRCHTELLRFEQDDGITAWLHDRRSGNDYVVHADYMIAADGASSPIRNHLGIGRTGRGHIRTLRSVLFRAPLEEYLRSGVSQFQIEQSDFEAFLTTYQDGRWVLMFADDMERDENMLLAAIQKAIGRKDVPIEIITTGRWQLSGSVADTFAAGRVLLAGDSAHTLPPNRGGFGANTGIHDAWNLAWKLDAVLKGHSTPALLDSYDDERRPVAWMRLKQIFARPDYRAMADGFAADEPILDDNALEFGELYRSSAVQAEHEDMPPAQRPEQWQGEPGTRVPHAWLTQGGATVSTLDLIGPDWVLMSADLRWQSDLDRISNGCGTPVRFALVGNGIPADHDAAVWAALGITKKRRHPHPPGRRDRLAIDRLPRRRCPVAGANACAPHRSAFGPGRLNNEAPRSNRTHFCDHAETMGFAETAEEGDGAIETAPSHEHYQPMVKVTLVGASVWTEGLKSPTSS